MKKLVIILLFTFTTITFAQEEVWYANAETAFSEQKYGDAIEHLEKIIEKNPKHLDAVYLRGLSYLFNNAPDKAVKDFDSVIKLDSTLSDAFNNRGLCYGYLGEVEKSIADFKKAIILDDTFAKAYLNLGSAYLTMGKMIDAIFILDKVVELDSLNPENYFIRGTALLFTEKYEEARDDFTKAIDFGLKTNKSYFNRASAFFNLKDYLNAIEDLTKALELNPQDVEALTNRSVCYSKLGLSAKADADKLHIYSIQSGLDKFDSLDDIVFKKLNNLSGKVTFEFPQNWLTHIEPTKHGEIMIASHDSVEKVSDFYMVGIRIAFDSSMVEQYQLEKKDDILDFWEYNAEMNRKEYLEFHELFRSNYEVDGYNGLIKEIMLKADNQSFTIKLFELVLVKDDNLFYAYLQSPAEIFDKMKPVFERIIKSIEFQK